MKLLTSMASMDFLNLFILLLYSLQDPSTHVLWKYIFMSDDMCSTNQKYINSYVRLYIWIVTYQSNKFFLWYTLYNLISY